MIRMLRAHEIEVRVSTISPKGLSLLLYKDARVDQNILDETFGLYGWKREHRYKNDALFCSVSIKDKESGEWIVKEDVGTESFADPVKGAASDSFKRACFNIGIGRELYSAPFIWISAEKTDIQDKNGKYYTKDRFSVASIGYDEDKRTITSLVIQNQRYEAVYSYGIKNHIEKHVEHRKSLSRKQLSDMKNEMKRTQVTEDRIKQRYGIDSLTSIDQHTYDSIMTALYRTKDAA